MLLHVAMVISLLASRLQTRSSLMIDMSETGNLPSIWKIDNAMPICISANTGVL
jgi:hypothetical protein